MQGRREHVSNRKLRLCLTIGGRQQIAAMGE